MQSCRSASERSRFFLFIPLFFIIISLQAQERCGVKPVDPAPFENWLEEKIKLRFSRLRAADITATVYEIPVVVHVIEPSSGSLNLTEERIVRQIDILTEDFRRMNADASNTPAVFLPVAADTEIQFTLARQDPGGNPTNGIVRITGPKDVYSVNTDHELLRSLSHWPPDHYLNIYVLDLASPFLGISSLPVTTLPGITNISDDYILDGVMVNYQYFGENPGASLFESLGRTTTHEVGHYFGLRHIWGDGGCSVDDFVDDTPVADDNNGGLGSPCTFPSDDNTVCVSDEMFQNYMDYTDDTCLNLFTEGQKTRMRTVLENSPRRISLITSPGLTEPSRVSNDLAITEIITPSFAECVNPVTPSIRVSNYGSNDITSFEITLSIDGSQVQTLPQAIPLATDETAVITFDPQVISNFPGEVSFQVSSVNGTSDGDPTNDQQSISLQSATSITLPFTDDFESSIQLLGSIGGTQPWEVTAAPNTVPTNNALVFKSYQNTTAFGSATILRTPVFDLSGINSAELSFSYAHAQLPDGYWDGLALKVSQDCGQTFAEQFVFNVYGPNLETSPSTTDSFIPQSELDWQDTTINITQFVGVDGVQFAFLGQNGNGNNIYLDNLSITQTALAANDVSLVEIDAPLITCRASTDVGIRIRNVGFEEINTLDFQFQNGENTFATSASNLSITSGDYQNLSLNADLVEGLNALTLTVTQVNGNSDNNTVGNSISYNIHRNSSRDSYPLIVDFETPNFWETATPNQTQLWQRSVVGSNGVLVANGFSTSEIGSQSWFISPSLDIGGLDTAGLSFKVSYANRPLFNDRLQVLMSVNCGENYTIELLNASSDSLAVTESSSSWLPNADSDWKEFNLDLSTSIPWRDEIRLAFVFTNGGGNNLFIDDINIGIMPQLAESNTFTIFPNPAQARFNIAFDLEERDDVEIQVMDMSGRVVFTRTYANVIDQVYDFDALTQGGFYFVKIVGDRINKTERLYIRR